MFQSSMEITNIFEWKPKYSYLFTGNRCDLTRDHISVKYFDSIVVLRIFYLFFKITYCALIFIFQIFSKRVTSHNF